MSSVALDEVALKDAAAAALQRGDLERAEMLYRNLLLYERDAHGEDFPGQLGVLSILARILVLRGDVTEAVLWLEKALVIHVTCFGVESEETAQAMMSLAAALRRKGDGQDEQHEAEQLYLQAMEILYKLHGPDGSAEVASAILGMGMCVERIGRLHDARQIYEDALAMRRKHLGANHADTGDALLCLAALLSRTWETSLAIARYEQAIDVFRHLYGASGSQHPRVELVKDSLSTLFRQQAKEQWEQSLFGEACVSSMAAEQRVLGCFIVSGYFYKKEKGPFGLSSVSKKIFAAIFPTDGTEPSGADAAAAGSGAITGGGGSGGGGNDGFSKPMLLLWAYDADLSSQGRALPGATVLGSVWRALQPAHARAAKSAADLYGEGTAVALVPGAEIRVGPAQDNSAQRVFSIVQPSQRAGGASELFSALTDDEGSLSAWNEAVVSGRVLSEE